MLMFYLPKEKIEMPSEKSSENSVETPKIQNEPPETKNYKYLNIAMGLKYSDDMEDIFKSILEIFCDMKDENKEKIQKAFEAEDWKNYTVFVHALKSTALSVGGEQLGELAKNLEMSGKVITDVNSSESDKKTAEEYIKAHHYDAMEIYEKLTEEGKQYLNE
jgi:HPt (histidine-containing phosphotransfer) domain-containing protein